MVRVQSKLSSVNLLHCGFLVLLLTTNRVVLHAQASLEQESAGEVPLTIERVLLAKAEAERSQELAADTRAYVLERYDAAVKFLNDAERFAKEAASFTAEASVSEVRIKALQEELDRQSSTPTVNVRSDWTVAQLEERRAEAAAELVAARQSLLDEDKLSSQRAARRKEISNRLGMLNQRLVEIDDEVRYVLETEGLAVVRIAEQTNLLARRQTIEAEIVALRAEINRHVARAPTLPLRRDRAQRRVVQAQQNVDILTSAAEQKRQEETKEKLAAIRQMSAEAVRKFPSLAPPADETLSLAESLYGPGGMQARIEEVSRSLNLTQKSIADLRQAFETSRRKWLVMGFRGTTAQWWPSVPIDFERPDLLRREIRLRESEIPETQHELILFEEARAASGDLPKELTVLLEKLSTETEASEQREIAALARDLLSTRRALLDELISNATRHSNLLYELDTASRELLAEVENLEEFVVARAIWMRSVPGSVFPAARDIAEACVWFFGNPSWIEVAKMTLTHPLRSSSAALGVVILLFLLWLRPLCRNYLDMTADQAGRRSVWGMTIMAIAFTVLLAVPLPAFLLGLSALLHFTEQFEVARAASAGLYACAMLAAALGLIAQSCQPRGLVETHFGWPADLTLSIRDNARLATAFALPFILVAFALRETGGRFHDPLDQQVWHNSLGRLCFVAAMILIAVFSCRALRVAAPVLSRFVRAPRWALRFRSIWLLLVASLSLIPAILALFGYYLTAELLVHFIFRSVWLALGLALLGGLLHRWEARQRHRFRTEQIASEALPEDAPPQLPAADAQVRQLLRFGILLVGLFGLFSIWARFVPALQVLDHVQIWPSIKIVSAAERAVSPAGRASAGASAGSTADDTSRSEEPEQAPAPLPRSPAAPSSLLASSSGQKTASTTSENDDVSDTGLMLSDFLLAVLIMLGTMITAKNIPGLLEFAVLPRIQAEAGVRIAISTLVRYAIVMVGFSIGLGLLGIRWSSIQWLAAALTFGLAFGLQEIFANFVSGLILLTERPIRVGDFVTVGATSGQVERIEMRATTIRAWDKSELVVPNKEFITGQLVNWTLSDPTARVEIRLSVAYGSNVRQVRETLLEIAHRHPSVMANPEPMAYFLEFGPSSLIFELQVFIDFRDNRLKVRDELQVEIEKVFREKGIVIAFPQMDVHIKTEASTKADNDGGVRHELESNA